MTFSEFILKYIEWNQDILISHMLMKEQNIQENKCGKSNLKVMISLFHGLLTLSQDMNIIFIGYKD